MSEIINKIKSYVESLPSELKIAKNNSYEFEYTVAERKTFLSKKKLVYKARFRIDDTAQKIHFTETLKESGFGFTSGVDDFDMSPGVGFKKGTYSSGKSGLSGSIEERSRLFGKDYKYSFDFGAIRDKIKNIAEGLGYRFEYHIIGLGN